MRYILAASIVVLLITGCAHQNHGSKSFASSFENREAAGASSLSEAQRAIFIQRAIEVAEGKFYSRPDRGGPAGDCSYLGDYDRTIPPRCYQSVDGSRVSVELTYYRSLSGRTGAALRVEFDAQTGELRKSVMETFVSDTL